MSLRLQSVYQYRCLLGFVSWNYRDIAFANVMSCGETIVMVAPAKIYPYRNSYGGTMVQRTVESVI